MTQDVFRPPAVVRPGYCIGDDPALRRRRRQLALCHARSRLPMHGGLSHRPGYAVVPQLELGAVRRAIALRGKESCGDRRCGGRFDARLAADLTAASATEHTPAARPRGCLLLAPGELTATRLPYGCWPRNLMSIRRGSQRRLGRPSAVIAGATVTDSRVSAISRRQSDERVVRNRSPRRRGPGIQFARYRLSASRRTASVALDGECRLDRLATLSAGPLAAAPDRIGQSAGSRSQQQ